MCCDSCIKSFCQSCIRRTSGEPFLQTLLQDNSTWNCYCCDSRSFTEQQQLCKDLCDYYRMRREHSHGKERGVVNSEKSDHETNPIIVSSTSGSKASVKQEGEEPEKRPDDKDRRGGRKKYKTPAMIGSDSSSSDGDSVEVHSDEVVMSDVEVSLKKDKKPSRRAVVRSSSESGQEAVTAKKGTDSGEEDSKALNKKKRLGRRGRVGSGGLLSSSDCSSDDEAGITRSPHSKKRSWSSSTSESTRKSKKLRHSELAAAVSSDSNCDDDGDGKRCGVVVGDVCNNSDIASILEGGDDSLDNITAVRYAPFRKLDTSESDDGDVPNQRQKGGVGVAKSSTDSEGGVDVGEKVTPVLVDSGSGTVGHSAIGPSNRKKKLRVLRHPLSSDDEVDSSDDPKDKTESKKEEKEEEEDSQEVVAGKKRRKIREIIADSKLTVLTKEAQKLEKERIERLKARAAKQDGTLAEQRLVLEEDTQTKAVKVEVRRSLVPSMLPHQRDGVKFLYDSCIESLERMKSEERTAGKGSGGGCILAHCMGLGKTLQVCGVTLLHVCEW